MNSPTPEEIRRVRESAGLSRKDAAAMIHQSVRSFEKYEIGERPLHPGLWELFTDKVAKLKAAAVPVRKPKIKKRRSKR